jgi:hypothetical protein
MPILVRSNKTLPELFDRVRECNTNEEKIDVLTKYKSRQMRWFVNATYNFDFSDFKIPEYTPNPKNRPQEICYLSLNKAVNRIESAINFHKLGNDKRYNDLMTIVLENVSYREAKLIEDLFTNKKIEGISKTVWKKMYPEFFRSQEEIQTTQIGN